VYYCFVDYRKCDCCSESDGSLSIHLEPRKCYFAVVGITADYVTLLWLVLLAVVLLFAMGFITALWTT